MKSLVIIYSLLFSLILFAQDPAKVAGPQQPSQVAAEIKKEAAAADADIEPQENPLVVPDEIFVPPSWLQTVVLSVKSMPLVGPYVVMGLQWLGVLLSILTALCAFALAVLKALSTVLSAAQMAEIALKIKALEKSKVMYWLKYLSAFNAPKEEKKS